MFKIELIDGKQHVIGVNFMISNQILQNTIEGLKGIMRIELCICDTEGKVLATTFRRRGI